MTSLLLALLALLISLFSPLAYSLASGKTQPTTFVAAVGVCLLALGKLAPTHNPHQTSLTLNSGSGHGEGRLARSQQRRGWGDAGHSVPRDPRRCDGSGLCVSPPSPGSGESVLDLPR